MTTSFHPSSFYGALLLLLCIMFSHPAYALLHLDAMTPETSVTLWGDRNNLRGDVTYRPGSFGSDNTIHYRYGDKEYEYHLPPEGCPSWYYDSINVVERTNRYVDLYLSTRHTFPMTSIRTLGPSNVGGPLITYMRISCNQFTEGYTYVESSYSGTCTTCIAPPYTPPPPPKSSCSFATSAFTINFTSASLNVDGDTSSVSVSLSCSSGSAQNYVLSLRASDVLAGRLNFGNGVSAQITINGTVLTPNGPGIPMYSLSSRSLPLTATLYGQSRSSGSFSSSGVLVLDIL